MSSPCPRCNNPATGNFCANCGAALPGATPSAPNRLPWIVTGVALVVVIALVLFQASRSATDGDAANAAPFTPLGSSGSAGTDGGTAAATDIASMSPQEKADRLFNRVMMYASEGKRDSAAIFAPMALQAFDMIAPLDVHGRYDVGLVSIVAGELARAKVQADTILRTNPADLLGLTLAMRVADASQNSASARDFGKRLIAAEPVERKTARAEYQAHGNDIDAALKDARTRKP